MGAHFVELFQKQLNKESKAGKRSKEADRRKKEFEHMQKNLDKIPEDVVSW